MSSLRGLCLIGAILLAACTDEDGGGGGDGGGGAGGTGTNPDDGGAIILCPPGELPLADGSCLPPGVPPNRCGQGFEPDDVGGCLAIEPAAPCEAGTMALLGETSCRAVEPCPTTKWGDAPAVPTTEYVDGAYTGGNSNGSQTNPWTSVQDGIDAAATGATVAIAAGSYAVAVTIDKPLVLRGTCAGEVELDGGNAAAVTITSSAVEVRSMAITTGASYGGAVEVDGGDALLERVWIHDASTIGVSASVEGGPTSVTIRSSLIEGNTIMGVWAWGADLAVEDSVVRDTACDGDGRYGRGIQSSVHEDTSTVGTAQIRRTRVERNHSTGIMAFGTAVTVEDSLVRDTLANEFGERGTAIEGGPDSSETHQASLTLNGVVVEKALQCGVCTYSSDLTADHLVVRGVLGQHYNGIHDPDLGMGVQVWAEREALPRPQGTITASIIEESLTLGLGFVGADATVVSTIVRDIDAPIGSGLRGNGIAATGCFETQEGANLEIAGAVIERATEVGVVSLGSHMVVDSVWVRDTQPRSSDGRYGAGVLFHKDVMFTDLPADGQVTRTVVDDCRAAGIAALGANVVASDIVVRNTQPHVGAIWGDGLIVSSYLVDFELQHSASLAVTRATIEDSERAGIADFGADLSVADSLLKCNTIHLNREEMLEAPASVVDGGGNQCRCDVEEDCKVVSSGLEPPPAL